MVKIRRIQSFILLVISLIVPLSLLSEFTSAGVVYSDDGQKRDDYLKTKTQTSFLSGYRAGTDGNNVHLPLLVSPNNRNVEFVGYIAGIAHSVTVAGNYAYVGDEDGGLHIVDISDSARPSATGFLATPGYIKDVAVAGGYAYVANSGDGLRIIDVSNPADPHEIGSYFLPGYFNGVAVAGNYVYVVGEYIGLRIIEVSDPTEPAEVGFIDTRQAFDVALAGNYAYSVDDGGLRIIDISNPTKPSETGLADKLYGSVSVALEGNYAFAAGRSGGLAIIDVGNPTSPTETSFFDTPGGPLSDSYGVDVSGHYAYLTDWNYGLRIIDVADPAKPREAGYYITPGLAFDVAVAGDLAYVAADHEGLLILHYTGANP